jgi:Protein of unknown function (DUF3180)
VATTRVSALLGLALVGIPAGWLFGRIVQAFSGATPPVPWVIAVLLAFMAALLLIGARVARGWIRERRYDSRVDALLVARMLALGKAAAAFGAVVAGAYVGIGAFAASQLSGTLMRDRLLLAGAVVAAAVVVAIAGVRLEFACRVPPEEPDEPDG